MSKSWVLVSLSVFVIFYSMNLRAQSFGFGCLGLVGGYAGYSYQIYKPTGLNNYIQSFNLIRNDSLQGSMKNFGKSSGYRIGINFFRADLKGLILTAKGFYQFLGENNDAFIISPYGSTYSSTFDFNLRSWGIGIDLGTSLTHSISWKVIDVSLLFNSAQFTNTTNYPGAQTIVNTYKTDKQVLGYTVGTGFILAIIGHYVSLEGFAGYTYLKIDMVRQDDGTYLTVNESSDTEMKNFIDKGGFSAVVQLNVGFPL
jgi:hypothetical protein